MAKKYINLENGVYVFKQLVNASHDLPLDAILSSDKLRPETQFYKKPSTDLIIEFILKEPIGVHIRKGDKTTHILPYPFNYQNICDFLNEQ